MNIHHKGLSAHEVEKRRKEFGQNELRLSSSFSLWKIFLMQFRSFMIYLLLFAIVFALLVGEVVDASVIAVIVLLNAFVGTRQEYSAQKSLEALKNFSRIYAKVYRDGNLITVDSKELVPGDIVVVSVGDKVPADGHILTASQCMVQEAILTGESESILKEANVNDKNLELLERRDMVFSGTLLTQGTATFEVVATGMKTQMGLIADLLTKDKEIQTPLQVKLDRFGRVVTIGVLIITILLFLTLVGQDFVAGTLSWSVVFSFFLVALSIAVAAVPEALPAVVTIALSVGVKKMLKKNVLIRTLASVETLGSCTVICTDKTGTLTQNQMSVVHARTPLTSVDFHIIGYNPVEKVVRKDSDMLFVIGQLCNNASIYKKDKEWQISGDPTEAALLVSAKKLMVEAPYTKVNEIPFDEERKMMSMIVQHDTSGDQLLMTKGALEQILACCTHVLEGEKKQILTDSQKEKILQKNQELTSKALRVLGCAYKNLASPDKAEETEMIFVGLQALMDPPRPDVRNAITHANNAGIRVIMITGDHPHTAQGIADLVGIGGHVLTSKDLNTMSDKEISLALKENVNIFARIIPQHKQKIVSLLQSQGHIVAMIGDGVNDAPALKQSHIGIAVETGSEIAKDASDCVLLDNNFTSIVHGIEQGRGMYDNIQKSIMLLLSGNFVEVTVLFVAIIFGRGLPITALMILWINLISDSLPAIAYSFDGFHPGIMKRKPIDPREGLLPYSRSLSLFGLGTLACIFALGLYKRALTNDPDLSQTLVFQYVVCFQLLLVLFVRYLYGNRFASNRILWGSLLLLVVLQLAVSYGVGSHLFDTIPLGIITWGRIIGLACMPFIIFLVIQFISRIAKR